MHLKLKTAQSCTHPLISQIWLPSRVPTAVMAAYELDTRLNILEASLTSPSCISFPHIHEVPVGHPGVDSGWAVKI